MRNCENVQTHPKASGASLTNGSGPWAASPTGFIPIVSFFGSVRFIPNVLCGPFLWVVRPRGLDRTDGL